MSNESQERLIHVLAAVVSWTVAHFFVERFLKAPRYRSMGDDAKEVLFKAGVSVAATIAASAIVRRVL